VCIRGTLDSPNYATCLSATGTPCRHSKTAKHVPYQQVFTVTYINTAQPHNAKHSYATGTNEFRNVASLPGRVHTLQCFSIREKTSAEYGPHVTRERWKKRRTPTYKMKLKCGEIYVTWASIMFRTCNNAHSCSRHGVVAARITSERQGNVIRLSENIFF
jgi:hypothetical protein